MLEPIVPKGTRASDVREEALATQPIEYRLPIEHIRRTGPRRLTRGDSAVDAEAWLFAPGGVTSLPSEPMVRTPPPALTYVKEEKHKKHTKDTRDTGESTRDTFRETKDTTKEATKESPRVIKEKKAKRKSPKSESSPSLLPSPGTSRASQRTSPGPTRFPKIISPPLVPCLREASKVDLGTSSLSPRQRTSSTHTTSKTQTRNTLATPIRVVLPDKLDVFHPYDLLETMEVDTKTVGLSFVSKPTDVRSTRHLLLKTVEEKIETQHWIDKKDFILIALGASTGLGNIWDLPHTASVYGGGTFLVAYVTAMLSVGIPFYYLEIIMAQFCGRGMTGVFRCCPLLKGTSYSMILYTWTTGACWLVFVTYCAAYIFYAIFKDLPWTTCQGTWSEDCFLPSQASSLCRNVNRTIYEMYFKLGSNDTQNGLAVVHKKRIIFVPEYVYTNHTRNCLNATRPAAEAFLVDELWGMSSGISDIGMAKLELTVILFVVWSLLFVCSKRGVTSKKCVKAMLILTLLTMGVSFARVAFLPGALDGMFSIFKVDAYHLLEFKVSASYDIL